MRTRTRKVCCGEDMRWREEHPGVARFRYRRLLAFLWLQGFESTFQSMLDQTTDFFCVEHLERLVSKGQWDDAEFYVSPRFVRTDDGTSPVSVEAHVLVNFLRMHRLIYSQQARANLNWGRVWSKAAEIVRDLANRTPEFKELLLLPDGPMGPRDVLPIGFGSASFRRKRHPKKRARRPQPSAIAKLYLDKMRSLPSSSECSSQVLSPPEFRASKAFDWLGHLLEECRQAGKIPKIYQGCPLQSTAKEGAPVAPVPQTMFGNLTNPSKISGITSVTDTCAAVAGSVIDPEDSLVPSVADKGVPVAPVPHAMFGNLTNPPKKFGIPSSTDTGSVVAGNMIDPKDFLAQSVTDTRAPLAPNWQLVVANVINSGISSVAKTGTSEEGRCTDSVSQGSHPRKNLRTELTIIEDYLDTKKQRTTGAFREASNVSVIDFSAEARSPDTLVDLSA